MKQRNKDHPKADEDEPELSVETLKDLTPSDDTAGDVKGGPTTPARLCECGTA